MLRFMRARWNFVVLLPTLGAALLVVWPREQRLLAKATPLAIVPHKPYVHLSGCAWLSDRELLATTLEQTTEMDYPCALDIHTGAVRRLSRLDLAVASPEYHNYNHTDEAYSPDGRWFLFNEINPNDGTRKWVAVALDGSRIVHWKVDYEQPGPYWMEWLPDSTGAIEWTWDEDGSRELRLYRLDARSPVRFARIPGFEEDSFVIGVVPTDRVLFADYKERKPGELLPFADVHWTDSGCTVRRYKVRVPGGGDAMEILLSPCGDKLAWRVEVKTTLPSIPLLRRALLAVGVHPRTLMGLWITDLQGRHAREIGHIECDPDDFGRIWLLNWTRDGKRILFTDWQLCEAAGPSFGAWRDRLYMAAVE